VVLPVPSFHVQNVAELKLPKQLLLLLFCMKSYVAELTRLKKAQLKYNSYAKDPKERQCNGYFLSVLLHRGTTKTKYFSFSFRKWFLSGTVIELCFCKKNTS